MLHRNAPLSVEGRRRLIERCRTRPIAHVAGEMGISRQCASKWVNRHRRFGETVDFDHIKRHYYATHEGINPTRIVPRGPDLAGWSEPHGRG